MNVLITTQTDVGIERQYQEDRFLVSGNLLNRIWKLENNRKYNIDNNILMMVADGMGGAEAGDQASLLVVKGIKEYFDTKVKNWNSFFSDVEIQLKKLAHFCNTTILKYIEQFPELQGMGSTLVLGLIHQGFLHLVWVGDSRCYLLREGQLALLTKDHSYVQSLVDAQQITAEQAFYHPKRNVITQSLGTTEIKPEYKRVALSVHDKILICSDGLNGMLPDEEIERILNIKQPLGIIAAQLINAANEAGGKDNITVVIGELVEQEKLIVTFCGDY